MEASDISESYIDNLIKKNITEQMAKILDTIKDDIKLYIEKNSEECRRLSGEIQILKTLIESSKFLEREKIAIFVDSQNLYYSARMGYAAKVNYEKLLRLITANRNLVKAYAYIVQPPDGDVKPFATSLERIGYIVKIKDVRTRSNGSAKANWDMGIALDILGILDRVDTIVLASGDGDFVSLVDFIKAKNKRVEIFAFAENTAYDLKEKADRFEPLGENIILT
jgi:uncharacterized LabA/DUF88 family protein